MFKLCMIAAGLSAPLLANYTYTTIDYPGQSFTVLSAIYNKGAIAGFIGSPISFSPPQMGILVEASGKAGPSFGIPGAVFTYALGVDNGGSVIGRSSALDDIFLRAPSGSISYLALPPGVTNATEAAISEKGRIVISATNSMYFLNGSTYKVVVVPGAGSGDNAVNVGGINDFGDVVGYFYTNSGTSPSFFRHRE